MNRLLPVAFVLVVLLLPASPAVALFGSTTVHIPLPSLGDEVTYNDTESGGDASGADAGGFVHYFSWGERATTADAWGRPRDVDVLHTYDQAAENSGNGSHKVWLESMHAFVGGALLPLWNTMEFNFSFGGSSPGVLGTPVGAFASGMSTSSTITSFSNGSAFTCDARNSLQGRTFSSGDLIPIDEVCADLGAANLTFTPHPAEGAMFLGHSALALPYSVHLVGVGKLVGDFSARFTFVDGLPYLAEFRLEGTSDGKSVSEVERIERYKHGDGGPLLDATVPLPELSARPGATFGRWSAKGPAEGSSALAYTLADAIANVESDATLTHFQSWRANHPDAIVASGAYAFGEACTGSVPPCSSLPTWRLTFAEGVDAFDVTSAPRAGSSALPAMTPAAARAQDTEVGARTIEYARAPHAPELPTRAIDLATALRAWNDQAPVGKTPTSFSFSALVPRTGPGALVRIAVAHSESASDGTTHTYEIEFDPASGRTVAITDGFSRFVTYSTLPIGGAPAIESVSFGSAPPSGFADGRVDLALGAASVSLVALLLAILAYARGWLTPLFTRLKRAEILESEARAALYAAIAAEPGIHLAALEARARIGHGATLYHLDTMEREGYVRSVEMPGFRRYFVTGAVSTETMRALAELAAGRAREIYEIVRTSPGISQLEVSERVGISPTAVSKTLVRMEKAGLVERTRDGKAVRVRVLPVEGLPSAN